eukprot:SAG11_NODE_2594_length_3186_cov_1.603822_3_plen_178_part_01
MCSALFVQVPLGPHTVATLIDDDVDAAMFGGRPGGGRGRAPHGSSVGPFSSLERDRRRATASAAATPSEQSGGGGGGSHPGSISTETSSEGLSASQAALAVHIPYDPRDEHRPEAPLPDKPAIKSRFEIKPEEVVGGKMEVQEQLQKKLATKDIPLSGAHVPPGPQGRWSLAFQVHSK